MHRRSKGLRPSNKTEDDGDLGTMSYKNSDESGVETDSSYQSSTDDRFGSKSVRRRKRTKRRSAAEDIIDGFAICSFETIENLKVFVEKNSRMKLPSSLSSTSDSEPETERPSSAGNSRAESRSPNSVRRNDGDRRKKERTNIKNKRSSRTAIRYESDSSSNSDRTLGRESSSIAKQQNLQNETSAETCFDEVGRNLSSVSSSAGNDVKRRDETAISNKEFRVFRSFSDCIPTHQASFERGGSPSVRLPVSSCTVVCVAEVESDAAASSSLRKDNEIKDNKYSERNIRLSGVKDQIGLSSDGRSAEADDVKKENKLPGKDCLYEAIKKKNTDNRWSPALPLDSCNWNVIKETAKYIKTENMATTPGVAYVKYSMSQEKESSVKVPSRPVEKIVISDDDRSAEKFSHDLDPVRSSSSKVIDKECCPRPANRLVDGDGERERERSCVISRSSSCETRCSLRRRGTSRDGSVGVLKNSASSAAAAAASTDVKRECLSPISVKGSSSHRSSSRSSSVQKKTLGNDKTSSSCSSSFPIFDHGLLSSPFISSGHHPGYPLPPGPQLQPATLNLNLSIPGLFAPTGLAQSSGILGSSSIGLHPSLLTTGPLLTAGITASPAMLGANPDLLQMQKELNLRFLQDHPVLPYSLPPIPLTLRTEMHQHQHLHHHQHLLPGPYLPATFPVTHNPLSFIQSMGPNAHDLMNHSQSLSEFAERERLATLQMRNSLLMDGFLPPSYSSLLPNGLGGNVRSGLTSKTHGAFRINENRSMSASHLLRSLRSEPTLQTGPHQHPSVAMPKKRGRWCSIHVELAWKIHMHKHRLLSIDATNGNNINNNNSNNPQRFTNHRLPSMTNSDLLVNSRDLRHPGVDNAFVRPMPKSFPFSDISVLSASSASTSLRPEGFARLPGGGAVVDRYDHPTLSASSNHIFGSSGSLLSASESRVKRRQQEQEGDHAAKKLKEEGSGGGRRMEGKPSYDMKIECSDLNRSRLNDRFNAEKKEQQQQQQNNSTHHHHLHQPSRNQQQQQQPGSQESKDLSRHHHHHRRPDSRSLFHPTSNDNRSSTKTTSGGSSSSSSCSQNKNRCSLLSSDVKNRERAFFDSSRKNEERPPSVESVADDRTGNYHHPLPPTPISLAGCTGHHHHHHQGSVQHAHMMNSLPDYHLRVGNNPAPPDPRKRLEPEAPGRDGIGMASFRLYPSSSSDRGGGEGGLGLGRIQTEPDLLKPFVDAARVRPTTDVYRSHRDGGLFIVGSGGGGGGDATGSGSSAAYSSGFPPPLIRMSSHLVPSSASSSTSSFGAVFKNRTTPYGPMGNGAMSYAAPADVMIPGLRNLHGTDVVGGGHLGHMMFR